MDYTVIIGARLRTNTKTSKDLEECFQVVTRLITSDTGATGEAWHPTALKNLCVDFDQGQAKALSSVFGNADIKGCYVRDRVLARACTHRSQTRDSNAPNCARGLGFSLQFHLVQSSKRIASRVCRSEAEERAFLVIAKAMQKPLTKLQIATLLDVRTIGVRFGMVVVAGMPSHTTRGKPLASISLMHAATVDDVRTSRAMQVLGGRQPYHVAVRVLSHLRLPELEYAPEWSSAGHWANYFKREMMLGK